VTASTTTRPKRRSIVANPALDAAGILVLAFALRFGVVLFSRGGPGGYYGYDSGVYYSAADALIHGRLPYRDFVFLHPPGLIVALTPFAALGRLTSDHTGYVVANTCVNLLAAINAVLVWQIARRWRLSRGAALLGGVFYAIWWGGINAEVGVRLEPLGTFAFLCGLLLLAGSERPGRRRSLLAGAALGVACCIKIWWVVPLLVILIWHLARRPTRRTGVLISAGAAAGSLVVAGPFFVLAPADMWHRVVTDQLGRAYDRAPFLRIQFLSGLRNALPRGSAPLVAIAAVVIAAVFVATIVVAARVAAARMVVAVLVVQFVVLLVAPSFFTFYSGYIAGALALTVAAAADARRERRPARVSRWVAEAAVITAAVVTLPALAHSRGLVAPFPGSRFERATAAVRCLMTDSPSVLILTNRLSSNLAHGCRNWVDVTGHTYFGRDASAHLTRPQNRPWQADVLKYLLSGDAVVVVRAGTGLSGATMKIITSHPVLAASGGYVVYAVR
jgi:alpha-1,2-mannosyltransferase